MRARISNILWRVGLYRYAAAILHWIERLTQSSKIETYIQHHSVRKLQIGAGPGIKEGWLNTDIDPGGYPLDKSNLTYLDAREPFPLPEASFDYVFTEHMIEHIGYEDGRHMLGECFRVLKPGGVLRISTPDLRFLINLYSSDKTELQQRYVEWSAQRYLEDTHGKLDTRVINNFFHDWGHRFIYDFEALATLLDEQGFTEITRCKLGQSQHEALTHLEYHGEEVTDEFNRLESMIVEATRPAR